MSVWLYFNAVKPVCCPSLVGLHHGIGWQFTILEDTTRFASIWPNCVTLCCNWSPSNQSIAKYAPCVLVCSVWSTWSTMDSNDQYVGDEWFKESRWWLMNVIQPNELESLASLHIICSQNNRLRTLEASGQLKCSNSYQWSTGSIPGPCYT